MAFPLPDSPARARALARTAPPACGLLPALLGSAAALALLLLRLRLSERASFIFLAWNLALAWAPYAFALCAAALGPRAPAPLQGALLVLWALFLPNAPYLLTDFVHLRVRPGVPVWLDIGLLALFAATGWLLGLLSLEVWRARWEARWGAAAAWALAALTCVACGYGIWLGRVLRWNSWDLLGAPGALCLQVLAHLRAPSAHPGLLSVTGVFGALMLLSSVAFALLRRTPAPPRA
ncbi:DUF1361 domain-containing protein [Aggregicoccus sp. 17bor-14]|uniref:DUF1361 domain-containing protein n=1 Tax=Myxococcaceae TaxID=31 RepID=UPI00129CA811|nr:MULTISPECIES: DUF1361 domain-containing protein [Myxococcaceae]MBF5043369.1 DUF1361 domain-containing protein [Simulacricoccus sp. 17bor-14]MRI89127.1 DUF1361 domain-containing protein [Aggregicoccus sp. 17bor-14]